MQSPAPLVSLASVAAPALRRRLELLLSPLQLGVAAIAQVTAVVLGFARRGAYAAGLALRYLWERVWLVLHLAAVLATALTYLLRGTTYSGTAIIRVVALMVAYMWSIVSAVTEAVGLAWFFICQKLWTFLSHLGTELAAVLTHSLSGASFLLRLAWLGGAAVAQLVAIMLGHVWSGVNTAMRYLRLTIDTTANPVRVASQRLWMGVYSAALMLNILFRSVYAVAHTTGQVVRSIFLAAWVTLRYLLETVLVAALTYLLRGTTFSLRLAWFGGTAVARVVALVVGYTGVGIANLLRHLWSGVYAMAGTAVRLMRYAWLRVLTIVWHLSEAVIIILKHVLIGAAIPLRLAWLGSFVAGHTAAGVLRYVWRGASTMAQAISIVFYQVWKVVSMIVGRVWFGVWTTILAIRWLLGRLLGSVSLMLRPIGIGTYTILHYLYVGVLTAVLIFVWTLHHLWHGVFTMLQGLMTSAFLVARIPLTAFAVAPDVWRAGVGVAKRRKGVSVMSDNNLTRERLLSLVVTAVFFFAVASIGLRAFWPAPPEPTVVVAHWTTGHLTRDGLLKEMAEEFNKTGYRISSGTRINVEVYDAPSELQGKYLSELLNFGTRLDLNKITNDYVVKNIPDPTIVTPSSAHWLVTTNYEVGRSVVDLTGAQSIVRPVIGIVTYEEMARCLGWPEKEIGFADIIALRNDPLGWASYPCAKAEWGQRPLLAFTDPTTSSTGRSLYFALYSFAANILPEELTIDDVSDPEVVAYVKEFQGMIDHYLIGTTVLNTKIHQGPRYGHFFIMPEDNLIHLYEGTERAFINGVKTTAPSIEESMVMIYPKEGSMPRNNCACIVQADWVSEEQVEASQQWIDFIREDEQQRTFMAAGFRPGTDLDLNYPGSKISREFGLNPNEPKVVLNPSLTRPDVAAAIDDSWELVKRPGVVTFVVDTSGSMMGGKIDQARNGLTRALDAMARNNQVGLLTFDDAVNSTIAVGPLRNNRFDMADAVHDIRARGETALYDAINAGIDMTASAAGEENAIRAVVVLTDGRANRGQTRLDDLVKMMSKNDETRIPEFGGFQNDTTAVDDRGRRVNKADVVGIGLTSGSPVQIFFLGIGDDADMEVGRILAEATGAEFQGVSEEDLANVLEEFSKYF